MAKGSDHRHAHMRRDVPKEFPGGSRQWTPLTTGFMVASIIGFFISLLYVSRFSIPMAVSFAVVFFCMFLASIISMSRASPDAQLGVRPVR